MAICYFDEYARVDGEWFFSRRRERHWYAADVTRTPQSAGFAGWAGSSQPKLPAEFASWAPFWDGDARPATLTKAPASPPPRDERSHPVKIGVWFDLRNPPAWRQDPARLYGFTLELCEEAEHLGADSVWFSEHHGFEDGYLPQPLTFAAAAAARTSRVRLGTGILVAPLRKTAQLAEEAAVVDIISGGRLDLGLERRVPHTGIRAVRHRLHRPVPTAGSAGQRAAPTVGRRRPHPSAGAGAAAHLAGLPGPKGARRAGRMGEGLLTAGESLLAALPRRPGRGWPRRDRGPDGRRSPGLRDR